MQLDSRSQRLFLRAGFLFFASFLALVVMTHMSAKPTELTYWEDQTGLPSRQQRWFQWQAMQDAGPPIGEHGMWWDGVDRMHMF
ncbi:hypothetical protein GUITHDRAFT_150897, partial [Guillardia theta CCMP2712]